MEQERFASGMWSGIFVFAEFVILYRRGVFHEMESLLEKGWGGFLIDAVVYAAGLAVVTALVCSTVIFRSEYFGVRFDSDDAIQKESGHVAKKGLLIAGIFYAIVLAVIIF